VLLLRRRHPPNAGLWNGVGGKLEPGEDPYTGCIREVAEETGLAIADPQLRALLVISVREPITLWVIFVFAASAPDAEPISSEEGELRWVELAAVPSVPLPPDVPLILPGLFTDDEVQVVRAEYSTEDLKTLTRLEVVKL